MNEWMTEWVNECPTFDVFWYKKNPKSTKMKLYQTAPLSRARPSLRGRGKWKRPCPPPHRGGNGFQMFSIQLDSFCLLKRIRYVTGCLGMPWTCRQMSTGNLIALWIQCVDMSTNVASVPIAVFFQMLFSPHAAKTISRKWCTAKSNKCLKGCIT